MKDTVVDSGPADRPAESSPQSAVIPTGQVVILREADLDCDLATAIEQIRANDETSRSRILVIGADDERGTAAPADADTPLPCPRMPMTPAQLGRRREIGALTEVGQRLAALLGCLDLFEDETAAALDELDESIQDQSRARLKNRVGVLRDIRAWAAQVTDDLRAEAQAAATGRRMCDSEELCDEVAGQVRARFPAIRIRRVPSAGHRLCRGRSADLAEAFFLALVLVAHRIGGAGVIQIEITAGEQFLVHRILGLGEPRRIRAPELVERFRELVVDRHGGRIQPDLHGPDGTGLTIELPLA